MLSEKYINALNGLKAQGGASHLFHGCEAEVQHIYRIIMTEEIPVNQLNEEILGRLLAKESTGIIDYSKYSDRDGLKYVDLEEDVQIYPSIMRGSSSYPIENQSYLLISLEVKSMLRQLKNLGQLSLISKTLQGLSERLDGTKLQTAFPSLDEINNCIHEGLVLPELLLKKIKEWEVLGANEINFDFVYLGKF